MSSLTTPQIDADMAWLQVEIIEVQCGDYLEEDDIVRLDDDYERDIEKKC